ncbi:MAG TPA: ABC transporter permease subunit [Myxococcaceae bacterium]|jgi:ABC-type transport system involved in multi-copper enzyme maturation permease subunit
MIRSFAALAWNGFREARRNRVTLVVAAFAVALLVSGMLLTSSAVAALERVLADVGLGSMSLSLSLLAVFLSSGLLSREIERRTIFLVVSKPVSRGRFLLARQAGNMITLTALLAAMSLLFWGQHVLYGYSATQPMVASVGGLWFELFLLSSLGLCLSSFAGQLTSGVVAIAVYLAGHLSADLYRLAAHAGSPGVQWLGKAAYYLLPNLEKVNFRGQATYNIPVEASAFWGGAAYALGYSAVLLGLGVIIFNRRDFK